MPRCVRPRWLALVASLSHSQLHISGHISLLQLADLGAAHFFDSTTPRNDHRLRKSEGTPHFIAPECLTGTCVCVQSFFSVHD